MTTLLAKLQKKWNLSEALSKNPIRGAFQAFIGSFCYLAIVSNSTVWNALTYQGISPVVGFIGFGLALQADIGGNATYVLVRTVATVSGGGVGLLILYLVFWCNGSSFDSTVTKGAVLVVFLSMSLSALAYHFHGPPWSARYKGVLIAGNMVIFVSTVGYWQDTVLPKIFAYTLLNMLMGLFIATTVSHFVFPITQGKNVVKKMNEVALMLSEATAAVVDEMRGHASSDDLLNEYIIPAGDSILKCKLMLQGSVPTEIDMRTWPFKRFPVKTYLNLGRISRQYLSVYATLVDLIHTSDFSWEDDLQHDTNNFIEMASAEICKTFKLFVEFTSSPNTNLYELGLARMKGLKTVLTLISRYLNSDFDGNLSGSIQGSSRAVLTTFWLLGLQVTDYYLLMMDIRMISYPEEQDMISEYQNAFIESLNSIKDNVVVKQPRIYSSGSDASVWSESLISFKLAEHSFQHHRSDILSKGIRKSIKAMHLKPLYLKHVLQQAIATTVAAILVVSTDSHSAFRGFADWILITVWVMGAQSTIGAVALKALNRVAGTILAGVLSYIIIYVVYLLNGLSYQNQASKYVFMTLLYPATLSFFHKGMLESSPEYQYAWYVMKLTLPIVVLSGYNDENPNPETAAWRILCILIGLAIEFVVKSLVYYRESSTSARHEIQRMCKSMSDLSSESVEPPIEKSQKEYFLYTPTHASGAQAAECALNIDKLQMYLVFEDKIQAYVCGLNVFDRNLITTTSLPRFRHQLRVILNRILTITYLKNSLIALNEDWKLDRGFVRHDLNDIVAKQIPQCLMAISDLFGPIRSSSTGFVQTKDRCSQNIFVLREYVSNLWKETLATSLNNQGGDVVTMTISIAYINIISSLAHAMTVLLDCICEHAHLDDTMTDKVCNG